jgi:hypothetical protein
MPDALADRVVTTVEATVHCRACAWCASLTGDTAAEVVAFLRALWQDHKTQRHQPPVERAS